MDILLIIILVEFILLLLYFLYAEVYFLLSIIIFLLYGVFKYFDGDEYTGFRSWGWLRKRTLFGKSVKYMFGNPVAFEAKHVRERMLFIVKGSQTGMGLIHGFAMHGGIFQHLDLVVLMPWILFKIPLLRDVLLWMGCVSDTGGSIDLINTQILRLLGKGKSVVYAIQDETGVQSAVFEFAVRHRITVVPVIIKGESARYYTLHYPFIQEWCMDRIGWPFPFWFFPRIFNNKPMDRLVVQIGTPMDGLIYNPEKKEDVTDIAKTFGALFMGQFGEV